jgi:hypothetical protein
LASHNVLEENEEGLYTSFHKFDEKESNHLIMQAIDISSINVVPYSKDPKVLEATRRAVERAGYEFDNY